MSRRVDIAPDLASALMDRILDGTYDPNASALLRGRLTSDATPDSLYDGAAGVVLTLAELCRNGFEAKYRDALIRGLERIGQACQEPPRDWSYFTGRTGALALLRDTRDLLGSDDLFRTALTQTERWQHAIAFGSCDLLGGAAGALLGGLQLLEESDPWIRRLIVESYERLVKDAEPAVAGYVWCREKLRVHPLCGLAHGASGIALALVELFSVTRLPEIAWLAEQPLAYEAARFDLEVGNWPDFRVSIGNRDALDRAALELPSAWSRWARGTDFVAWCHGAPGIGWVRKHAIEVLGPGGGRLEEVRRSLARTRTWVEANTSPKEVFQTPLSLCHGLSGNLAFLRDVGESAVDGSLQAGVDTLLEAAAAFGPQGTFAQRFLQPELGKDGLFPGVTGVVYFLSKVSTGSQAAVLLPTTTRREPNLAEQIRKVPFKSHFETKEALFAPRRSLAARLRSEALAILRLRRARQMCRKWLQDHPQFSREALLRTDPALVLVDESAPERLTRALRPGMGGIQTLGLPHPEATLVCFAQSGRTIEACLGKLGDCLPDAAPGERSGRLRVAIEHALLGPETVWQELAPIPLFE